MTGTPLDDTYRGKISLVIVEGDPAREVWIDMVDYVARFGRKRLEDRLAEGDLWLIAEDERETRP